MGQLSLERKDTNGIEGNEGEWARADKCNRGGRGGGRKGWGADYCQLLQFKAATINKDVVTDRLAAAVKNTQDSTMKK